MTAAMTKRRRPTIISWTLPRCAQRRSTSSPVAASDEMAEERQRSPSTTSHAPVSRSRRALVGLEDLAPWLYSLKSAAWLKRIASLGPSRTTATEEVGRASLSEAAGRRERGVASRHMACGVQPAATAVQAPPCRQGTRNMAATDRDESPWWRTAPPKSESRATSTRLKRRARPEQAGRRTRLPAHGEKGEDVRQATASAERSCCKSIISSPLA